MKNLIYDIDVHETFPAAHQVHGTAGPCSRLHGHNWKVRVRLSGSKLDNVGYLADFYEVRKWVRLHIISPLDHQFINQLPEFNHINPTCEHILKWMFETLSKNIKVSFPMLELVSVQLWENEDFTLTLTQRSQGDR